MFLSSYVLFKVYRRDEMCFMVCRTDHALEEYRQTLERSDQADGGETPPPLSSPIHLNPEEPVGYIYMYVCVCV